VFVSAGKGDRISGKRLSGNATAFLRNAGLARGMPLLLWSQESVAGVIAASARRDAQGL
jgi:hypothetical protein